MINWDKPNKVRSTDEHNEMHSSDSGVAGTYAPNMSKEDMQTWKGKHVNKGKENERIELRKTFSNGNNYAQVLVVVTDSVTISTNGKIDMTYSDIEEFRSVINEAKQIMGIE